jgi:predicted RNA-binding Zn-ribbon protein involved in translation (DUF1610 family)
MKRIGWGKQRPEDLFSPEEILSAAGRIAVGRRAEPGARKKLAPCASCGQPLTARQRRMRLCPLCGGKTKI